MTLPDRRLRLVHDHGQIENGTLGLRRFLGIPDQEPTELTFFVRGRIHLAHAATVRDHMRLLRDSEKFPGFNGAYQLVNGPINPAIFARYQSNRIHPAWNGRVGDSDIELRRAVYIDIDPIRPKGISATDDEKRAARDVCSRVEDLLLTVLQDECVLGRGDSGNGYFILIAIEPAPISAQSTARIRELLKRLAAAYDTDRVKIDTSVGNAGRLMPAVGTWKRKGENTPERPHRQSSFSCCAACAEWRWRVSLATVIDALGEALGRAPALESARPLRMREPDGVFARANAVDTVLVLDRCGIEHDEKFARCPGCGEAGALICRTGGIKCLHARCSAIGPANFPGLRLNVDLVVQHEGLSPVAAAERICQWFSLEDSRRSAPNGSATAAAQWNRPLSLSDHRGTARFPTHALGAVLREWVEAEATATQTPPDLAAVVVLATISACVAKKFEVEIRPGWREPLNTYWLVALEPGNRKSAVFRDAVRPLHDHEREVSEALRDQVQAATVAREIKQRELKRAIDLAARSGLSTDRQCAAELAIELEGQRIPVIPRLVVDDVTPERLAAALAEQGGRLALLSAEGGLFEVAGGRYSDGVPNLDVLLKGHPGDDLRVDRIGRSPVHVRHPALTLGVAVQPEVVRELARKAAFRGSGLLARFFYSLPESTVGRRIACPPPVPEAVSERYHQLCTFLLRIAEHRADGEVVSRPIYFSPGACGRLERFSEDLEPRLSAGSELGPICDWANKLAGGIARVAALLHLAGCRDHCGYSGNCGSPNESASEGGHDHCGYSGNCGNPNESTSEGGPEHCGYSGKDGKIEIEVETIDRSILIGLYLLTHAQAAFAFMGTDPEIENAKQLLSWILDHRVSRFTKRDAWQATRGRFKKASELDAPLSLLIAHGYLAEEQSHERPGQGRKPSPSFKVNPYTHNSQNTHNG